MKIKFLLALFFGTTASFFAQGYDFSVSTGTYNDLIGNTSLNNGNLWLPNDEYVVPIGFSFDLGGQTFNTIYFTGWNGGSILSSNQTGTGVIDMLQVCEGDLIDFGYLNQPQVSQTNISYKTEGNPGNRILKIEWNKAGFYNDIELTDYAHFQAWLYEGTNTIEYHYGPSLILDPDQSFEGNLGPTVALIPALNLNTSSFEETGYLLSGDPEAPIVIELCDGCPPPTASLNGMPPEGTIYTFTPKKLSIDTPADEQDSFIIVPNPVTDRFRIVTTQMDEPDEVTLYNTLGQKVKHWGQPSDYFDASYIPSGMYFLELKTRNDKTARTMLMIKQ